MQRLPRPEWPDVPLEEVERPLAEVGHDADRRGRLRQELDLGRVHRGRMKMENGIQKMFPLSFVLDSRRQRRRNVRGKSSQTSRVDCAFFKLFRLLFVF